MASGSPSGSTSFGGEREGERLVKRRGEWEEKRSTVRRKEQHVK